MIPDSPGKISRRTLAYWYVDGLVEIAVGVVLLLVALLYLLIAWIEPSQSPAANWLMGLGQPVIMVAGYLIGSKIILKLKERLTFPRTGYVSYRRPRGTQLWVRAAFAAGVAAGVAFLLVMLQGYINQRYLPVATMLMVALMLIYFAYSYSLARFYWAAGLVVLLGLLDAFLNLPDKLSTSLLYVCIGIVLIGTGTWTLLHYLKTTRPAQEQE